MPEALPDPHGWGGGSPRRSPDTAHVLVRTPGRLRWGHELSEQGRGGFSFSLVGPGSPALLVRDTYWSLAAVTPESRPSLAACLVCLSEEILPPSFTFRMAGRFSLLGRGPHLIGWFAARAEWAPSQGGLSGQGREGRGGPHFVPSWEKAEARFACSISNTGTSPCRQTLPGFLPGSGILTRGSPPPNPSLRKQTLKSEGGKRRREDM